MEVSKRQWWYRIDTRVTGPLTEDEFQAKLRAGQIPLHASVKNTKMDQWCQLLVVVSSDPTFRRQSSIPPPPLSQDE